MIVKNIFTTNGQDYFGRKDELAKVIKLILSTADLQGCSIEDVCTCVLENNLE